MKLFEKLAVNLNHGVIGDAFSKPGIVYPRVIEAKGKNQEQYPDWAYEEE